MISDWTTSAPLPSGFFSRLERMTSTRSLGRMKPPAPVSGEISVEIARMPVGRMAAMKPEPLALTSFCSRIGSPRDEGGARDRTGDFLDRLGPAGAVDQIVAGRSRPGLPLQILRLDRLAEPDVGLRDQNFHRRQLRDRFGHGARFFFRATGEIGGDTAGTQGDDQNDDTCDIHTLLLLLRIRRDAPTARQPQPSPEV